MRKIVKQMKKVEVTKVFCDICGGDWYTVCRACKREICKKHTVKEEDTNSDYSTYYCNECNKIKEPFKLKISELDEQVDEIDREMGDALAVFKKGLNNK